MMADFWMRLIDSTVELPVENETCTDAGPDRHVNQSAFVPASAPACFSQGGCVCVILHGHFHLKGLHKISNRILAFPTGKEVDIPDLASPVDPIPMPEICALAVCAVAWSIPTMRNSAS
jgi:hypothetical protein